MSRDRTLLACLVATALSCGSPRDGVTPAAAPAPSDGTAAADRAAIDYLIIGPRALLPEVKPLVDLRTRLGHGVDWITLEEIYRRRSDGAPSAEAVRAEVAEVAARRPSLRYLLLLGDPASGGVASTLQTAATGLPFHSDQPFSLPGRNPPLAVGRIPARTPVELRAAVSKIVRYETAPVHGAWGRRVSVFAGPAKFGRIADAFLERAASAILESIPYDFDVQVTFAKEDSPYAYAFDRLTGKIADELAAGALVAVYTGHGSERALDTVLWRGRFYSIGDTAGLAGVRTAEGNPFFISLTCLTGRFGVNSSTRSLAEEMALNPDGPVAAFAASAESHPLANITLGQGFLASLFVDRAGTIGEAIGRARKGLDRTGAPAMAFLGESSGPDMWQENAAMYNLFGDPATRLRYPGGAEVTPSATTSKPGASQRVAVSAPAIADGTAVVTVEIQRSRLRDGIVPPDRIEALDREQALETMIANNRLANDRVLARAEVKLTGGRGEVELAMPDTPGRYAIKAIVDGGGKVAVGSAWIEVGP